MGFSFKLDVVRKNVGERDEGVVIFIVGFLVEVSVGICVGITVGLNIRP